jgi:hypothetical protein
MPISKWRFLGASVQGTSHLTKNTPCQDAHAYLQTSTGVLLLAVADGAGSAERSQEGAQLAVNEVVNALLSMLQSSVPDTDSNWRELIVRAFSETLQVIIDLASVNHLPLNTFSTTLACAVVTNDWFVVGQIGDAAIVFENADGELSLAVHPQRGEYANEAYFLTMPDGMNYLTCYTSRDFVKSVVLTTDGLLRLAFQLPDYRPSPLFFQPIITFLADMEDAEQARLKLVEFLNSARINSRTDDDKTLVLATRVRSVLEDNSDPTNDDGWKK